MKLSEARFKPLFLRLLEWAGATAAATASSDAPVLLGRAAALFGAVDALAGRLRSVFVPYFRWVTRQPTCAASAGPLPYFKWHANWDLICLPLLLV